MAPSTRSGSCRMKILFLAPQPSSRCGDAAGRPPHGAGARPPRPPGGPPERSRRRARSHSGVRHLRSLRLPSAAEGRPSWPRCCSTCLSWGKRSGEWPPAVRRRARGRGSGAPGGAVHSAAGRAPVADVDSSIPDQLRHSASPGVRPPVAAEALERRAAVARRRCHRVHELDRRRARRAPQAGSSRSRTRRSWTATLRHRKRSRPCGTRLGLPPFPWSSTRAFEPLQGVRPPRGRRSLGSEACFLFMGGEPAEIDALKVRTATQGTATRCIFSGKRTALRVAVFLPWSDVLVSPRRPGQNTPFKVFTYLARGAALVAAAPTIPSSSTIPWPFSWSRLPKACGGIRQALADPPRRGTGRAGPGPHRREYSPAVYAKRWPGLRGDRRLRPRTLARCGRPGLARLERSWTSSPWASGGDGEPPTPQQLRPRGRVGATGRLSGGRTVYSERRFPGRLPAS